MKKFGKKKKDREEEMKLWLEMFGHRLGGTDEEFKSGEELCEEALKIFDKQIEGENK